PRKPHFSFPAWIWPAARAAIGPIQTCANGKEIRGRCTGSTGAPDQLLTLLPSAPPLEQCAGSVKPSGAQLHPGGPPGFTKQRAQASGGLQEPRIGVTFARSPPSVPNGSRGGSVIRQQNSYLCDRLEAACCTMKNIYNK